MSGKSILVRASFILLTMVIIMVVALIIAGTAIDHPAEAAAFDIWLHASSSGWLIWRLIIYAALGWGVWKIYRAPGFRDEYRQSLRRIAAVSVFFILLCEYALLSQTGS